MVRSRVYAVSIEGARAKMNRDSTGFSHAKRSTERLLYRRWAGSLRNIFSSTDELPRVSSGGPLYS